MANERLPGDGRARFGPVTLPAGRLIPGYDPRDHVAWATVDPVPGSDGPRVRSDLGVLDVANGASRAGTSSPTTTWPSTPRWKSVNRSVISTPRTVAMANARSHRCVMMFG